MGGGDEQDAVSLPEASLDRGSQHIGLAGTGWPPDERQFAAQRLADSALLVRVPPDLSGGEDLRGHQSIVPGGGPGSGRDNRGGQPQRAGRAPRPNLLQS